MKAREGFTTVEIVVVLGLLGLLLGIAMPPTLRWRDAASVRAASDEIAAGLARTRVAAIARGGASLWLDSASFWITDRDGGKVASPVDLSDRYGVTMRTGAAVPVEIRYDGIGVGRLANRTVRVRRGGALAGVTVSAYGRFRRW